MEQMYGRIFHDLKTGEILVFDKKNLPFLTTVEKARSCGFKVPAIIPKPKKNEPLKQKYIEEIITEAFPRIEWISDKKIEGGKSSKRPDMRGEYNGMVFIIEVDESQHRKYGARKEFMRTKTIEKDLEGKVGFIFRFNPDEYFDVEENEIPSSLVVNNGFVYERKDFKSRIRFLISSIKSKFYYKPKSMEEIFLFYDGFSKQNVSESSESDSEDDEEPNEAIVAIEKLKEIGVHPEVYEKAYRYIFGRDLSVSHKNLWINCTMKHSQKISSDDENVTLQSFPVRKVEVEIDFKQF